MKTEVCLWGNRLPLLIPEDVAMEMSLPLGVPMQVSLENGQLVLPREGAPSLPLEALFAALSPEGFLAGRPQERSSQH